MRYLVILSKWQFFCQQNIHVPAWFNESRYNAIPERIKIIIHILAVNTSVRKF